MKICVSQHWLQWKHLLVPNNLPNDALDLALSRPWPHHHLSPQPWRLSRHTRGVSRKKKKPVTRKQQQAPPSQHKGRKHTFIFHPPWHRDGAAMEWQSAGRANFAALLKEELAIDAGRCHCAWPSGVTWFAKIKWSLQIRPPLLRCEGGKKPSCVHFNFFFSSVKTLVFFLWILRFLIQSLSMLWVFIFAQ